MGSLSKNPTMFYKDTQEETAILIDIDDIIGEIGVAKRISLTQTMALRQFQEQFLKCDQSRRAAYKGEILQKFEALETEAERVRAMITTLLNLRQKEVTLEDALSMGEQSTMLFVFTVVTVLFVSLDFPPHSLRSPCYKNANISQLH